MRSKDEFQNLELDSGKRKTERSQKVYSYSKNETEQSINRIKTDIQIDTALILIDFYTAQ